MPIHRVPRATLHEDLIDITRKQCERLLSVMPDPADPAFFMVVTNYEPIETRSNVTVIDRRASA